MEEIYEKYSKLVYNYLYRLTNDIELSEELMQETFYSAIKGLNKFKGECKVSVWLCQIAKNKWKYYLKKNKKIHETALDGIMENLLVEDDDYKQIFDKDEILQLYKYIHNLEKDIREIFYLRLRGNLSFKDISEITGKSEEWARVNFYRGKLKIKESLLKDEKRV